MYGLFQPFLPIVAPDNEMCYISERTPRRAFNEINNSQLKLLLVVVYFTECAPSHYFPNTYELNFHYDNMNQEPL